MIPPSRQQILRLYKHLIKYGNQLKLTDKNYFLGRVRSEFRSNRGITDPLQIEFSFKVKHCCVRVEYSKHNMLSSLLRIYSTNNSARYLAAQFRYKSNNNLDYSRYPTLNEADIEETFTRGSGPGGQAVNKTSNCVFLRHIPTNITIKCHMHRVASRNRTEARKLLLEKLDIHLNGENSIAAQLKVIEQKKSSERKRRQQKTQELKQNWKARESNSEEHS